MSAAQQAPSWSDLYLSCLTLDEDGRVTEVNVDQWNALDELRAPLGEPFPMEVGRLVLTTHEVSAWMGRGLLALRGEAAVRLLACDIVERAIPSGAPGARLVRVARAYARGDVGREVLEQAQQRARDLTERFPQQCALKAVRWLLRCDPVANQRLAERAARITSWAAGARRPDERRWQTERAALYVAGVLP